MMSKSHPAHRRQMGTVPALSPRSSTFAGGNVVELPDTGITPVNPKPEDQRFSGLSAS